MLLCIHPCSKIQILQYFLVFCLSWKLQFLSLSRYSSTCVNDKLSLFTNGSTVLLQTHSSDTPHMATVTQHAQTSLLASQTYQLFCTTICKIRDWEFTEQINRCCQTFRSVLWRSIIEHVQLNMTYRCLCVLSDLALITSIFQQEINVPLIS